METKSTHFLRLSIILLIILSTSCSKLTKVKDLVDKPTAREKYERQFQEDSPLFNSWKEASEMALLDSLSIPVPYVEKGRFVAESLVVHSYEVVLNAGERLQVQVETDSAEALVFLDLYQQNNDTLSTFEHLLSSEYGASRLQKEIDEPGLYKLLIQPEIAANTQFSIQVYKEPVYAFPVASRDNSAVQSFWGAERDGGRRSHEGIDIFAPRGTPVLAVTEGRVSSTGNRGLGGKQVWLRDQKRGNSLYYAHLDSIIASPGMKVQKGDTLGLIGNTGNARTTAPHLHFGIYKGFRGAQNPLPYVYKTKKPEIDTSLEVINSRLLVSKATANLRKGPSTKAEIAGRLSPQDTLSLLGETEDWYHARLKAENFYLHKSLATPL